MTMITRLARLVRADLNAVLDRLEAPELVLAQAVRDMEQALDRERRAVAGLDRELARLARRDRALAEEEARCNGAVAAGLEPDATEGSAAERDDLVRPLIRCRLEAARRRRALKDRAAEIEAERDRIAARCETQAARLDDLRSRAALAAPAATESAPEDPASPRWRAPGELSWSVPEPVAEAEVTLELIRLRRQGVGRGGAA